VTTKVKELEVEKATALMKLMGDKTRLLMMKLLENNECCVCEFVGMFELSQSAISQHLRKLKDMGLLKEKRRGQWVFYTLDTDSELYEMAVQLLAFIPDQGERIAELEKQGLRIICD
jgi:ArsR family transcriptional regulator, arsenate/arsenite/antimonite-responsive transcriptional repressor